MLLHYSVHLTPFSAKDVPILRDILHRNALRKQFKGVFDIVISNTFAISGCARGCQLKRYYLLKH